MRQIEHEEERRKALLEGANQDDDDFTWEDDDEVQDGEAQFSPSKVENATPVNRSSSTVNTQLHTYPDSAEPVAAAPPSNGPSSTSQTPVCISPRESDDSYDVVSSGNVSSTGGRSGEKRTKGQKGEEDGDESDWE